jgi:uncharacterized phiE125 gp8 family phage protein
MAVRVITPPATLPLTLAEAKAHLRVDHDDEDALISTYLAAATKHAEEFTGRAFITQTLELVLDEFKPQIFIPRPPLQYVMSVLYADEPSGAEQLLTENTDYVVDTANEPGWVVAVGGEWPPTRDVVNAVRIRYVAGYISGDSPPVASVPEDIKAAILLMTGSLYSHRESVVVGTIAGQLPWNAEQLLRPKRVELSMA